LRITLILLSFTIAVYFILWSNRVAKKWIRHSFLLYSILFTIVAVSISGVYVIKHTSTLAATAKQALSGSPIEPAEAKTALEEKSVKITNSVQLKAPEISQLPELPRGCEVTALSMLLEYHNIDSDKMKLAKKMKRDPTPYQKREGKIRFGNPHNGFVGDMYSLANPGLGVYHEPVPILPVTTPENVCLTSLDRTSTKLSIS